MCYKKRNTLTYKKRISINGNRNFICYDSKDVVPQFLGSISYSDFNTFSPLHIPMKEHDIIMDEKNKIAGI